MAASRVWAEAAEFRPLAGSALSTISVHLQNARVLAPGEDPPSHGVLVMSQRVEFAEDVMASQRRDKELGIAGTRYGMLPAEVEILAIDPDGALRPMQAAVAWYIYNDSDSASFSGD